MVICLIPGPHCWACNHWCIHGRQQPARGAAAASSGAAIPGSRPATTAGTLCIWAGAIPQLLKTTVRPFYVLRLQWGTKGVQDEIFNVKQRTETSNGMKCVTTLWTVYIRRSVNGIKLYALLLNEQCCCI